MSTLNVDHSPEMTIIGCIGPFCNISLMALDLYVNYHEDYFIWAVCMIIFRFKLAAASRIRQSGHTCQCLQLLTVTSIQLPCLPSTTAKNSASKSFGHNVATKDKRSCAA